MQYVIYHYPWCGNKLPKRIRDGLLAPPDEYTRIVEKATTVLTAGDCVTDFGDPDYNKPFPDERGLPSDTFNIEFYGISAWYILEFYSTGTNGRFVIYAKRLSL